MCDFYKDEAGRRQGICHILQTYGIDIRPGAIGGSEYKTDGHVATPTHPKFILEIKNEIGSTGAEPSLQALLYYRVFCDQLGLWDDDSTCHPCFIGFLAGPHLGFAGCALTNRPTLEIFSLLPLGFHETNDDAYAALARHLCALKKALDTLDNHINEVDSRRALAFPATRLTRWRSTRPSTFAGEPQELLASCLSVMYPYPVAFTPYGYHEEQKSFTYDAELEQRNLLFKGKAAHEQICIKFVRKYGKDVHIWCADKGFAPRLIAFDELPGNWYMVIMDLLDESWVSMANTQVRPDGLKEVIHATITELHQAGMVHGDIRTTNIMVKKDGGTSFMLIDYDWAGKQGEVMYPRHVNKASGLGRPESVEDGRLITSEHDDLMMQHLFRTL
jgi:hypothetical protein